MRKPRVVIQYPFIPLYRIPIFQRLGNSSRFDYTFWAGRESPDKYLKTGFSIPGLRVDEVPLVIKRIPLLGKQIELQLSAIWKLVKQRPDIYILLANPNSLSSWLCMLVARTMRIPVIAWSHGYLSNEKGLKGFVRSIYYHLATGHLLYGDRAKAIMTGKGFDPERIDPIYNSLDYAAQSRLRDGLGIGDRLETRKDLGIPASATVLIAIGRLMSKLKIDQAIRGIAMLQQQGGEVFLLVVGDGPEMQKLRHIAEELGVRDKVVFYGSSHDETQLSKLFNASDISVVMGKVGLSAMHALAYGIPMLTNSCLDEHFPEVEAVVEGETGWYFEKDNLDDFIQKIRPVEYRGAVYRSCIKLIESRYTPERQFEFIERAIAKHLKIA